MNTLQTRYVDLHFDGDRTISGTLMRYGDVAEFPWGDKERFEPGAFGNVPGADAILHKQHDRSDPIARTGGGGLKFTDSPTTLELRATLPNTTAANDVLELVKPQEPGGQGILRGLSVEFIPDKHRIEANRDGTYTVVHQKATLRGAGVVDRPQFKESTLREEELTLREQFRALTEDKGMEKDEIQRMVDDMLAKREETQAAKDANATGFATAIDEALKRFSEGQTESIAAAIETAIAKREEAAVAEAAAEAERMGKDKMDDDDEGKDGKKKKKMPFDMAEVDTMVEYRADLLVQVGGLLPKDFDRAGKTNHEILVAAAGDEVERAAEQSEDYLKAKVEGILERREAAGNQSTEWTVQSDSKNRVNPNTPNVDLYKIENRYVGTRTTDMLRMVERRNSVNAKYRSDNKCHFSRNYNINPGQLAFRVRLPNPTARTG